MEKRKRVVVYGNTLNMAGIAASLKTEASLEIICIDPQSLAGRRNLNEQDPQTIIFDWSNSKNIQDLALLREQPGLLLVGVDPSRDEALVLSGQLTKVLSGKDLVRLVTDFKQTPKE